jgi:hypothetical protein
MLVVPADRFFADSYIDDKFVGVTVGQRAFIAD